MESQYVSGPGCMGRRPKEQRIVWDPGDQTSLKLMLLALFGYRVQDGVVVPIEEE
jgi:hypothetical protein